MAPLEEHRQRSCCGTLCGENRERSCRDTASAPCTPRRCRMSLQSDTWGIPSRLVLRRRIHSTTLCENLPRARLCSETHTPQIACRRSCPRGSWRHGDVRGSRAARPRAESFRFTRLGVFGARVNHIFSNVGPAQRCNGTFPPASEETEAAKITEIFGARRGKNEGRRQRRRLRDAAFWGNVFFCKSSLISVRTKTFRVVLISRS